MVRKSLIEVFGERPSRLRTLAQGLDKINLKKTPCILEIGCAYGSGISYVCKKTDGIGYAIDIESEYINKAIDLYPHINFQCASVYELPYDNHIFDLVFCEASFSLLKEKEKAIRECHRVMKKDGYIILNDFIIKNEIANKIKGEMNFIPCFNFIGTINEYIHMFESNSFSTIYAEEKYKEIIETTLHLSKYYKCKPKEIVSIFAAILGSNEHDTKNCKAFFANSKVSYAQMLLQKT